VRIVTQKKAKTMLFWLSLLTGILMKI